MSPSLASAGLSLEVVGTVGDAALEVAAVSQGVQLALRGLAVEVAAAARANVSLAPQAALTRECGAVPEGLEWAAVAFDFTLLDSATGRLPFPVALDLRYNTPGFVSYTYRRRRALYLCAAGRWERAATFGCANFSWALTDADRVLEPTQFLLAVACHNSPFGVLQQANSTCAAAFVRGCDDCVPGYGGCACTAHQLTATGFTTAPLEWVLAAVTAAAAFFVPLCRRRRPSSKGDDDSGRPLLRRFRVRVAHTCEPRSALSPVVAFLAWAALAIRSQGEAALPGVPHRTWLGVALGAAAGAWLFAPCLGRRGEVAAALLDAFTVLWWALPAAFSSVPWFSVALGATFAALRLLVFFLPQAPWLLVLVVELVRFFTLARVPCE